MPDPRRKERVHRYHAVKESEVPSISEHVNAVGMVCSLVGLLMKVRKYC